MSVFSFSVTFFWLFLLKYLTFKFSMFYSNHSDYLFSRGLTTAWFWAWISWTLVEIRQLVVVLENWEMGDHFVLLVNRLLTESTLEAAIESRNLSMQATASTVDDTKIDKSFQKMDFGDISTPRKLVECRICQDEDDDSNMETPCSCCGSLKVRWAFIFLYQPKIIFIYIGAFWKIMNSFHAYENEC